MSAPDHLSGRVDRPAQSASGESARPDRFPRVPVLRIGHGNGKNKPSLVDFVLDADADSFSCLESQRIDRLERLPAHRVTVAGSGWAEERQRARSTRILTRDRLENIGELTRLASEKLPRFERVAPDRVLLASMYEHPAARAVGRDGVAHLVLHPNAGPDALRGDDPDHPIVREYRESWQTTRRFAHTCRLDGLLVVITTDAQMVPGLNVPWNPARTVAQPLRLGVAHVGIDWVMYDRLLDLHRLETRRLFDHTGFIAHLRPAP